MGVQLKRRTLSVVLTTGMLVIGCPRPGLAPEEGSNAGGSSGSTNTSATGGAGTTTGGGGTSTTDTDCTMASCTSEVAFLVLGKAGLDIGRDIRVADDGAALVTGTESPTEDNADAFAMRVGVNGAVLWSTALHQTIKQERAHSIVENGGFVYVAGAAIFDDADYLDACVTRLDAAGNVDTDTTYSSPGIDEALFLQSAGAGKGVFVAGSVGGATTGPVGTPAGFGEPNDIFLTRLEEVGLASWQLLLPVVANDNPTTVSAFARNDVFHTSFLGLNLRPPSTVTVPLSFGGPEPLESGMSDMGDAAVLVIDEGLSQDAPVTQVIRFASETNEDTIAALAADPDGASFYVAGTYSGLNFAVNGVPVPAAALAESRDVFIAKVRTDGTYAWVRRFHGPGEQGVGGLAFSDTGLYFAGTFSDDGTEFDDPNSGSGTPVTHTGGVDFVVARLNPETGTVALLQTSRGEGDEWPAAIAVDSGQVTGQAAIWLTGEFTGDLMFVGKTAEADALYDGFVFRVPL